MKILIAEDDAVFRRILQIAIEKFGHACTVAADGAEAWALYRREHPDVLVTDWMMPGLDGPELVGRIREETDQYCYVIMLTALDDHAHHVAGMKAGADDYLTKPLKRDELETRLVSAARVTALHGRLAERESDLERLNERLQLQSRRDHLTQLGNRLRLQEDIETLHARCSRYGHAYSLALCDLDRFKHYNDRHGHQAGDEVLRTVAQTLVSESRSSDTAYRYGGEELLVLLPEQTPPTTHVVVERIRQAVEGLALSHPDNEPFGVVTISIGAAAYASGDETSDEVLARADSALYLAKQRGRNRVVLEGAVRTRA